MSLKSPLSIRDNWTIKSSYSTRKSSYCMKISMYAEHFLHNIKLFKIYTNKKNLTCLFLSHNLYKIIPVTSCILPDLCISNLFKSKNLNKNCPVTSFLQSYTMYATWFIYFNFKKLNKNTPVTSCLFLSHLVYCTWAYII